jgi:hypothetical protein
MKQKLCSAITTLAGILATVCFASLIPASGQTSATAKATSSWTPPSTPDGQPDIQGIYARAGIWGLAPEQHDANAPHGKEDPSDDSEYNILPGGQRRTRRSSASTEPREYRPQGEDGAIVPLAGPIPAGVGHVGLVDPPDKILPWKPEEDKKRREFLLHTNPAASLRYVDYDARCALPGLFLNGGPFEFIQTDKQLVILSEYQHYTRTLHLDGRPHIGNNIRLFMGDSIGHWEGNTLIVDTTNFNEFTGFTRHIPYLSDALHVIERFTIMDENNIYYEVTIDDSELFTKPWKTAGLYRKSKPGFELAEYACAEGTQTLENIFGTPPTR